MENMSIELKVPAVGESITEVEIGQWRKKAGDRVEKDEVVVILETEKASVDCGPRVEEVWNRLNRATRRRPMTIQRARFLPKLFTLQAFQKRLGAHAASTAPRDRRQQKIGCSRH